MLKTVDAMIAFANPVMDKTTMKFLTNIRSACVLKCTDAVVPAPVPADGIRYVIAILLSMIINYA